MEQDKYRVEASGYLLSQADHRFVKEVISDLFWAAPYQSYLKVLLSHNKSSFEGLFNLNSVAVRFETHQKSQSFNRTFELAIHKLHKQIRKWKKTRFADGVYANKHFPYKLKAVS